MMNDEEMSREEKIELRRRAMMRRLIKCSQCGDMLVPISLPNEVQWACTHCRPDIMVRAPLEPEAEG